MSAATIVFAREDFSIPGVAPGDDGGALDAESHFFALVRDSNPDVIVLDLSRNPSVGIAAILKIRRRCQTPILAVCAPGDVKIAEFRIAGAADCIPTPVDLLLLNDRLQEIIRVTQRALQRRYPTGDTVEFGGLTFYPYRDLLTAPNGATLTLTTSESRLLRHFVSHPWRLCSRTELVAALYGADRLAGDRAIDVIINRLRRKLILLGGPAARTLIKTEFRRGYLLVATVSTAERAAA
ncbi:MAG TPA: response regulator transcription factor [Xanthobacteraceae bacterium]